MARDQRLSLEDSKFMEKVRLLNGSNSQPIRLADDDLGKLIGQTYFDLGKAEELRRIGLGYLIPPSDYFLAADGWYKEQFNPAAGDSPFDVIDLYLKATNDLPDFRTYLRCIAELHKRRLKYASIPASWAKMLTNSKFASLLRPVGRDAFRKSWTLPPTAGTPGFVHSCWYSIRRQIRGSQSW